MHEETEREGQRTEMLMAMVRYWDPKFLWFGWFNLKVWMQAEFEQILHKHDNMQYSHQSTNVLDYGPLWQGFGGSGSCLSASHGPTGCYCSPKPFFSLLLSSLTVTAGAGEARFSGSAAPAAEAGAAGALPNRLNWIFDEFSRAWQSSRSISICRGLCHYLWVKTKKQKIESVST